jgi:hypothetical protein
MFGSPFRAEGVLQNWLNDENENAAAPTPSVLRKSRRLNEFFIS